MFDALSTLIGAGGQAAFSVRQGSLYFNGLRIKFVLPNYPIFKFVLEEFRKKAIGGIRFLEGLTLDELVRFMTMLAKKEKTARTTFEEMAADVADAGIDDVDPGEDPSRTRPSPAPKRTRPSSTF